MEKPVRARMKGECEVVPVTQWMTHTPDLNDAPQWAREACESRMDRYGFCEFACNGRGFTSGWYFVRWPHGMVSVINHQEFNLLFDCEATDDR